MMPTAPKEMWASLRDLLRNPKALLGGAALLPIGIVLFQQFMESVDASGLSILLPEIRKEFNLSLETLTAITSIAAVLALGFGVPVASLADRSHHRVRWLVIGSTVAGLALISVGLAPTFLLFFAFRTVAGFSLRVTDPVQQSLLADYSPLQARATVFSARVMMSTIARGIGPILFGVIATLAGWRPAFVVAAVLSLSLALVTLKLKEPVRGRQERIGLGVTGADADVEEAPPSFDEAVQILNGVGTVKRLWYAVPFLVGGLASFQLFFGLYLEEVFGLNPAQRGLITSIDQPFALLGLLAGIPIATRYLSSPHPERLFRVFAGLGLLSGGLLVAMAAAPNIPLLVIANCAFSFSVVILTPGLLAAFSLIFPPRARSVGFALTALCAIPGILFLRVMGGLGQAYGTRWGLFAAAPVFSIGALILSTAGGRFRADMLRARLAALAGLESRRAREAGSPKLLVCRGVDVSYGQAQVLFGVNLDVEEGEMVALLGTNGAGKSTLLRAISGTVTPSGGAIIYDGRDITSAPAPVTAQLGIVQVPGGRGVFPTLTVAENLRVAAWLYRKEPEHVATATEDVLTLFPPLREHLEHEAGTLSGGVQQMLALAQAFVARPRLLVIDELSLGLAPTVLNRLLDVVRAIHARGTTVILVEQSVNVALQLCERAVFLEKGEVVFEGPAAELLERPDILRSVFLRAAPARTSPRQAGNGEPDDKTGPVLRAEALTKRFGGILAVDGVSLSLDRGEVLGLIGANGAGKTTLLDLLSGHRLADFGSISLEGTNVTTWGPDRRARAGLGRSFQNAFLFPSLTVAETLSVALERHIEVRDPLSTIFALPAARDSEAAVLTRVDQLIELLQLGAYRDKFVAELSTGTRRVVDIGCCLAHHPTVVLLDEPSSGIAQRETEALGPMLLQVRDQTGASLIVIEHDIPLISSISDRLIALEAGREIAAGSPSEVLAHPAVVSSYLGTDPATIARSGERELTIIGEGT